MGKSIIEFPAPTGYFNMAKIITEITANVIPITKT